MKRMLTRKRLSLMRGLTLLETMFAIAIGALVLIGAVIFYMSTKQNANVSKTVGDMNAIVAAYQNFIAGGNTLSSATTIGVLQTKGFLPGTGGNLYDAWGVTYTATPTVPTTGGATTVLIEVGGLGVSAYQDNTDPQNPKQVAGDTNCNAIAAAVGTGAVPVTTGTTCAFTYTL